MISFSKTTHPAIEIINRLGQPRSCSPLSSFTSSRIWCLLVVGSFPSFTNILNLLSCPRSFRASRLLPRGWDVLPLHPSRFSFDREVQKTVRASEIGPAATVIFVIVDIAFSDVFTEAFCAPDHRHHFDMPPPPLWPPALPREFRTHREGADGDAAFRPRRTSTYESYALIVPRS